MIGNDERRRIAAKLRACAGTEYIEVEELCEAIECIDGFRGDDGEPAVWNRLADLVEPSCDRDALLALANEMEGWARDGGDGFEPVLSRAGCAAYARRIREACGKAGI